MQQQPTPSTATNFYDQTLYTTHAPYSNPYSNYFGDQGTYGSEVTNHYLTTGTSYTTSNPYMQVSEAEDALY